MFKTFRALSFLFLAAFSFCQSPLFAFEQNQQQTAAKQSEAPAETHQQAAKSDLININTADNQTLQKLPGIGEKTAKKIIDFRSANGDFATKEELQNVKGIGEKTFNKVKHLITI
jgi:competence protein ComEA